MERLKSVCFFLNKNVTAPIRTFWQGAGRGALQILKSRRIKILRIPLILILVLLILSCLIYTSVGTMGRSYSFSLEEAPPSQAAIVLGAFVDDKGEPCAMLYDRIVIGVLLYRRGKVGKILMTGDHSLADYDEVNSMRRYAARWGVPPEDIFMDHAGFCTYDSMYRARDIFRVKSAIIVTQEFHLPRAIYTARKMGIEAYGVKADRREYYLPGLFLLKGREFISRLNAFLMLNVTKPKPFFLGETIPIDGDGRATCDDKSLAPEKEPDI